MGEGAATQSRSGERRAAGQIGRAGGICAPAEPAASLSPVCARLPSRPWQRETKKRETKTGQRRLSAQERFQTSVWPSPRQRRLCPKTARVRSRAPSGAHEGEMAEHSGKARLPAKSGAPPKWGATRERVPPGGLTSSRRIFASSKALFSRGRTPRPVGLGASPAPARREQRTARRTFEAQVSRSWSWHARLRTPPAAAAGEWNLSIAWARKPSARNSSARKP
jgi:hypothetical protein